MTDLNSIVLKNVELKWPYLESPQTRGEYASNKYQVDVIMSADQAKAVKELINPRQQIKKTDDGRYQITLKSSKKPKVTDKNKSVMSDDDIKAIGNGTVAHVKANQYKGFKEQVFLGLRAVMVTDFKKYDGGDDFEDIEVASDDDAAPFDTDDDDII